MPTTRTVLYKSNLHLAKGPKTCLTHVGCDKVAKIAGNSYLNLELDLPLLNDDSSRAFLALGKQTGINLCYLQLLLISKAAK